MAAWRRRRVVLSCVCPTPLRVRGAESVRPDQPAEVLLAGDPDAGPDVEVRGPPGKAHLLSGLQTQQVSERSGGAACGGVRRRRDLPTALKEKRYERRWRRIDVMLLDRGLALPARKKKKKKSLDVPPALTFNFGQMTAGGRRRRFAPPPPPTPPCVLMVNMLQRAPAGGRVSGRKQDRKWIRSPSQLDLFGGGV